MILFLIALAMGVLKITGYLSVSWFWIAMVWPVFPVVVFIACATIAVWEESNGR
jgi:hypothetical protein